MSAYTKIPQSKIAATVGKPIAKYLGQISETGNKALDYVEFLISDTRQKSSIIKKEILEIQAEALKEATALEREATKRANKVLSEKATTAYDSFLNKTLPGHNKGRVDVDVSPTVQELHWKAQKLLDQAAGRVADLTAESIRLSDTALKVADTTLGIVETSIGTVLKYVKTFRSLIKIIRVPLITLKAAIKIIKAIPLPQRYLIVSFTILQSDLLDKMEQIIAQAEEEVRAIEAILANVIATLQPLQYRIQRIRAMIAALKTNNLLLRADDKDLSILDQAGLYDKDSGDSLFDKIQDGQSGGGSCCPFGNIGDVDLNSPYVGNQIQTANPGDYIHCPGHTSGSYVEDYYKWQVEKPPYPQGRPEDEGWSRYPDRPNDRIQDPNEKLWRLSLLETEGRIYGGFDSNIDEVPRQDWDEFFKTIDQFKSIQAGVGNKSDKEGEVINYDPLTGFRFDRNILLLDEHNFDQKPGILRPSSWDALEAAALNKLRNLPLSDQLRNYLMDLWQTSAAEEAGTSTLTNDAVAYRAANGELYYLRVVEDTHSPKVAVRRYVEVRDEGNTVIIEGTKTFSLNKDILIEEMKIQLDQLTR